MGLTDNGTTEEYYPAYFSSASTANVHYEQMWTLIADSMSNLFSFLVAVKLKNDF